MATKGNRRYMPIEKYPVYNDTYDRELVNSQVFNTFSHIDVNTILWDKQNIMNEIFRYYGNKEGYYLEHDQPVRALIPSIMDKLEDLENRFKEIKVQMVNEGYEEPEKMPINMLNQKYILEAKMDVYEKEKLELGKRLAAYTDAEKNKKDEEILAYGLSCCGNLRDGILIGIDGQDVIKHKGTLVIINGPYRGMSVIDYRKLAERWRLEREKVPPLTGGLKVPRETLPKFPEDFKNYFDHESSDIS